MSASVSIPEGLEADGVTTQGHLRPSSSSRICACARKRRELENFRAHFRFPRFAPNHPAARDAQCIGESRAAHGSFLELRLAPTACRRTEFVSRAPSSAVSWQQQIICRAVCVMHESHRNREMKGAAHQPVRAQQTEMQMKIVASAWRTAAVIDGRVLGLAPNIAPL